MKGNYQCICRHCGEIFYNDNKREISCLVCIGKQTMTKDNTELKPFKSDVTKTYLCNDCGNVYPCYLMFEAHPDGDDPSTCVMKSGTKVQWQRENRPTEEALQNRLQDAENMASKAIAYIKECPCDPDIYPDQMIAWKAYQIAITGYKEK